MAQESKGKSVFVNEYIKQKANEKKGNKQLSSLVDQFFYQYSDMSLTAKDLEMWLAEFEDNYDEMLKYDDGKKIEGENITNFIKKVFKNLLNDTLVELTQTQQQKKKTTEKGDYESNSAEQINEATEGIDVNEWYKRYSSMKYVILIANMCIFYDILII